MNPKTHAISSTGFEKLRQEWNDLKLVQRPAMQKQVADAAAEGDRSENAAYTYGKMKLRDIDRRLRKLDFLLDNARIIDTDAIERGKIWFGARVRVRNQSSAKEDCYELVGSAESDALQGKISLDSPLGLALKGKAIGETISCPTPKGARELLILGIEYP